jgi:hypothetical protein
MKYHFTTLLILLFNTGIAREGMWLPQLLKELNEGDMKSMGMQLSAEDIYSINNSSLKDAVLQFGGGCTGELISRNGLLITNHHCGFSQIQSLSTIEKNYLDSGFWAMKAEDELPCPGLTATFVREIKDVSNEVLFGINDTLNEETRNQLIKIRTDSIEKTIGSGMKGMVRSFYHGNKYFLFIVEVFKDVRFVGAPPQSIGKYGGETDNWIWPRHTGDFALFRIYTGKDNKPADYSTENIPYKPAKFLTISIAGLEEEDFILVFGFPGRTNEYLPSSGLEVIAEQTNPNRIKIREERLSVLREAMSMNDTVRLQYASKFSSLENAYKKWKGELSGFKRFNAIGNKKLQEEKFIDDIMNIPALNGDQNIFRNYKEVSDNTRPINHAIDFYTEAFPGIELVNANKRFTSLIELCDNKDKNDSTIQEEVFKVKKDFRIFYKNYNEWVDKKICKSMLDLSCASLDKKYLPVELNEKRSKDGSFNEYIDELYNESLVSDSTRLMKFLSSFKRKQVKEIKEDPAYRLSASFNTVQKNLQADLGKSNRELSRLQRIYMRDLIALDTAKKLFPDANGTLRVSYGKVEGTEARDGVYYNYFTTGDGILEKSETGIDDYVIPQRLSTLLKIRDYGRYGAKGELPVAFIASAHTTGGNSGSPALNSKGELVGVNFDRIWEGVLSDYYYDEKYCRNICLDIRYALFIIEKYGNAKHLIEEMSISTE